MWLTGIVLAGVALRIGLLNEPMRYDEAFTLDRYAIHGYGFIASTYDFPNNHILYNLLAHTTWLIAGDHVWTVRIPAFLAGVGLIPATYLAARECYGAAVGLCAATLAALAVSTVERRFGWPPARIAFTSALTVALALAVVLIDRGEHGADGAPMTDNDLAAFVRTHLGPGGTLALDTYMNVPAAYYLRVHHYRTPMYTLGHAGATLVLLVGDRPATAADELLAHVTRSHVTMTHTVPVAHLDYITAYRADVSPRPG